jgi:hypothetical protein
MKIWFDYCLNFTTDSDTPVKLGINWYRHINTSRKLKSWFGFTVVMHLFKYTVSVNFVDDFKAYNAKINLRFSQYKIREYKRVE